MPKSKEPKKSKKEPARGAETEEPARSRSGELNADSVEAAAGAQKFDKKARRKSEANLAAPATRPDRPQRPQRPKRRSRSGKIATRGAKLTGVSSAELGTLRPGARKKVAESVERSGWVFVRGNCQRLLAAAVQSGIEPPSDGTAKTQKAVRLHIDSKKSLALFQGEAGSWLWAVLDPLNDSLELHSGEDVQDAKTELVRALLLTDDRTTLLPIDELAVPEGYRPPSKKDIKASGGAEQRFPTRYHILVIRSRKGAKSTESKFRGKAQMLLTLRSAEARNDWMASIDTAIVLSLLQADASSLMNQWTKAATEVDELRSFVPFNGDWSKILAEAELERADIEPVKFEDERGPGTADENDDDESDPSFIDELASIAADSFFEADTAFEGLTQAFEEDGFFAGEDSPFDPKFDEGEEWKQAWNAFDEKLDGLFDDDEFNIDDDDMFSNLWEDSTGAPESTSLGSLSSSDNALTSSMTDLVDASKTPAKGLRRSVTDLEENAPSKHDENRPASSGMMIDRRTGSVRKGRRRHEENPLWKIGVVDSKDRSVNFGSVVSARHPTFVILTRGFGCILARALITAIAEQQAAFDHLGIAVVVVSPDSAGSGAADVKNLFNFHGKVLVDSPRFLYNALGCTRGLSGAFSRRTLQAAKKAVAAGIRPGDDVVDPLQLGGMFLLSRQRGIVWEHREEFLGDHPSLLSLVRRCTRAVNQLDPFSFAPAVDLTLAASAASKKESDSKKKSSSLISVHDKTWNVEGPSKKAVSCLESGKDMRPRLIFDKLLVSPFSDKFSGKPHINWVVRKPPTSTSPFELGVVSLLLPPDNRSAADAEVATDLQLGSSDCGAVVRLSTSVYDERVLIPDAIIAPFVSALVAGAKRAMKAAEKSFKRWLVRRVPSLQGFKTWSRIGMPAGLPTSTPTLMSVHTAFEVALSGWDALFDIGKRFSFALLCESDDETISESSTFWNVAAVLGDKRKLKDIAKFGAHLGGLDVTGVNDTDVSYVASIARPSSSDPEKVGEGSAKSSKSSVAGRKEREQERQESTRVLVPGGSSKRSQVSRKTKRTKRTNTGDLKLSKEAGLPVMWHVGPLLQGTAREAVIESDAVVVVYNESGKKLDLKKLQQKRLSGAIASVFVILTPQRDGSTPKNQRCRVDIASAPGVELTSSGPRIGIIDVPLIDGVTSDKSAADLTTAEAVDVALHTKAVRKQRSWLLAKLANLDVLARLHTDNAGEYSKKTRRANLSMLSELAELATGKSSRTKISKLSGGEVNQVSADPRVRKSLVVALLKAGRVEDAMMQISELMILNPQDPEPYVMRARACEAIDDANGAKEYLKQAKAIDPDHFAVKDFEKTLEQKERAERASDLRIFGRSLNEMKAAQRPIYPFARIPVLIARLLDTMKENGVYETEGVFRLSSSKSEVDAVRYALDAGLANIDLLGKPANVHTTCSVLKLFLRELPEAVITTEVYGKAVSLPFSMNFIADLPEINRNVLHAVVGFLKSMVEPEVIAKTRMHTSNLATVFAPGFLRCPSDDPIEVLTASQREVDLVTYLIEEWKKPQKDPLFRVLETSPNIMLVATPTQPVPGMDYSVWKKHKTDEVASPQAEDQSDSDEESSRGSTSRRGSLAATEGASDNESDAVQINVQEDLRDIPEELEEEFDQDPDTALASIIDLASGALADEGTDAEALRSTLRQISSLARKHGRW